MVIGPQDNLFKLIVKVRGHRLRFRNRYRDNPLLMNLAEDLKHTPPLRLRHYLKNKIETSSDRFIEGFLRRTNLFAFKRRFMFPLTILAGLFYGYHL